MKIVDKKVDELIPYINNPRINDNAVDAVASSIKNFGFKVPIVIDHGNEIITGHTRLKAAKKLGLEEVPCVIADDLTPEKIKAFRLADNKTSEFAEWDMELLRNELEELMGSDADILSTAFTQAEIDGMFDEIFIDDFFDEATERTPENNEPKTITCQCCKSILDQSTGEVIIEAD